MHIGSTVESLSPETASAHREYCRIFNKIKRAAKTKYYTEMLDQRKSSIKETWAVLRQVK